MVRSVALIRRCLVPFGGFVVFLLGALGGWVSISGHDEVTVDVKVAAAIEL